MLTSKTFTSGLLAIPTYRVYRLYDCTTKCVPILFHNYFIGSTTTSSRLSSIAIGAAIGIPCGIVLLLCVLYICLKCDQSCSHRVPPLRTVDVSSTTSPRTTAPQPHGADFMAVKEGDFEIKAEEKAYPQAQTHSGETPPDYNSAMNVH